MNKKIVGILIVMLLIGTALPAVGSINELIDEVSQSKFFLHNNSLTTSQNGIILAQELNENNRGYTVMRVWGSHYEMGYAQAELMGDYIVQGIDEVKSYVGSDYDEIRGIISAAIFLPEDIEDEFDGMVDSLAANYPSENIDEIDLKVVNTIGDWAYQKYGCRSHTCWGRYVSDPIKTISTRRLDFNALVPSIYHHVLCVRIPDDGSPQWVNLAWPGFITSVTSVNEFGVLVSSHDYNSQVDFLAGRMPRMVAFRYASTYATNPDLSTHLTDVYGEMQNYEIMTGGFLNYYAPEGYGGVMTFNPFQSGSDFYHLRVPQSNWHHGEAMITTNAWTDGTYTPADEDFNADDYYDEESPKTHDSHWDLLDKSGMGVRNVHMLSVAYRGPEDMTIWAEGKISSGSRTPRLEWEWYDLFNAEPPTIPDISGEVNGKNGNEYEYSFSSTDANGDEIYYYIDWGDESDEEIIGPISSGDIASANHTWVEQGNYFIRVKAKDIIGLESDWGELEVSMPRNKPFLNNLEKYPIIYQILQKYLLINIEKKTDESEQASKYFVFGIMDEMDSTPSYVDYNVELFSFIIGNGETHNFNAGEMIRLYAPKFIIDIGKLVIGMCSDYGIIG